MTDVALLEDSNSLVISTPSALIRLDLLGGGRGGAHAKQQQGGNTGSAIFEGVGE